MENQNTLPTLRSQEASSDSPKIPDVDYPVERAVNSALRSHMDALHELSAATIEMDKAKEVLTMATDRVNTAIKTATDTNKAFHLTLARSQGFGMGAVSKWLNLP